MQIYQSNTEPYFAPDDLEYAQAPETERVSTLYSRPKPTHMGDTFGSNEDERRLDRKVQTFITNETE